MEKLNFDFSGMNDKRTNIADKIQKQMSQISDHSAPLTQSVDWKHTPLTFSISNRVKVTKLTDIQFHNW